MTTPETVPSPKLTYIAVSAALLVPVLIWPLFWWQGGELNPGMNIAAIWRLAAATLLLSAIAVDSVLNFRYDHLSPFFAAGWVLFGTLAVSTSLRLENGDFLIACLFALHALRSASRLWQHDASWWLWPAWCRDSLAALGMFIWLYLLGHA